MHVSDEWYIQGQTADGVHVHEQAVSLQGVKREKGKARGGGGVLEVDAGGRQGLPKLAAGAQTS